MFGKSLRPRVVQVIPVSVFQKLLKALPGCIIALEIGLRRCFGKQIVRMIGPYLQCLAERRLGLRYLFLMFIAYTLDQVRPAQNKLRLSLVAGAAHVCQHHFGLRSCRLEIPHLARGIPCLIVRRVCSDRHPVYPLDGNLPAQKPSDARASAGGLNHKSSWL